MLLFLTGCALFISDAEHSARQEAMLADTSDSGDPMVENPYARDYDGELSIEIEMNGEPKCDGSLDVTVYSDGTLQGNGECDFISLIDLFIVMEGTIDGDLASGTITINGKLSDPWTGSFFTSGNNTQLQGSFSGSIPFGGEEHTYSAVFVLD